METARADSGVPEAVAQARREVFAAELECRRLVQAPAEARRQAELDRTLAEQQRDQAVRRTHERSGPDPDLLTMAAIAAATLKSTVHQLVGGLDAAITGRPDLSAAGTGEFAGERRVGFTEEDLRTEVGSGSLRAPVVSSTPA